MSDPTDIQELIHTERPGMKKALRLSALIAVLYLVLIAILSGDPHLEHHGSSHDHGHETHEPSNQHH